MKTNITRIILATAFILAPAAAFAQPHTAPVPVRDHTPVVHDHAPAPQGHTVVVVAHR